MLTETGSGFTGVSGEHGKVTLELSADGADRSKGVLTVGD